MKYTVQNTINLPIDRVIELYDNPDNLKHWQPGLQSIELLSGEPRQAGAKSLITFQMGKRKMEMVETLMVHNLPEELTFSYDTKPMFNIVKNHFTAVGESQTLLQTHCEFQFKSFPMKIMGWLMPSMFKKQSQKYSDQFKAFAESQG